MINVGLILTEVTLNYLRTLKNGVTEVGKTSFEVWHNMTPAQLEEMAAMFLEASPPEITDELFCLYVAVYCDEMGDEEILCLTKEMYDEFNF